MISTRRIPLVVLIALVALGAASSAWAQAKPELMLVRVNTLDDEGKQLWARFQVRDADGNFRQPPTSIRDLTSRAQQSVGVEYMGSFVGDGEFDIELEPGEYQVIARRGPEYNPAEASVTVVQGEPAEVTLVMKRWIDMNADGWWSADFHLHRPLADVPLLLKAEDLNLAVALGLWNSADNLEGLAWPRRPAEQIEPNRYMTVRNAEDERGGGAWMLHQLSNRIDLTELERWSPSGVEVISKALEQRYVPGRLPWIEVEKPFWKEVPVVMALTPPNSIGLLHNHFLEYGVYADEAWGKPRDRAEYPEDMGFVDYSLELNYRYWNLGFDIPPTAGSASGVLPNPAGYNRLYVELHEPFTVEAFYRALDQNRSFVTNGPMLFFDAYEVPGKQLLVQLDARSQGPLDRVELVANGKVIQTFEAPEGKTRFQTEVALRSGRYSWIAARAFAKSDDTIRIAHTRPVFFTNTRWRPNEDAAYFVKWIEDLIAEASDETNPERIEDPERRKRLIDLYQEARAVYANMR